MNTFNPLPYTNRIVKFKNKRLQKDFEKKYPNLEFITEVTKEAYSNKIYNEGNKVAVYTYPEDNSDEDYL